MKKIIRFAMIAFLVLSFINPVSAATYNTDGQEVQISSATAGTTSNTITIELAAGTYKAGSYELIAHEGVYEIPGYGSNVGTQGSLPWKVASTFTLSSAEVATLKNSSLYKTITTTFDIGPSDFKVFVGTGNAGNAGSGTNPGTDLDAVLSGGIDLSAFMTSNRLDIYYNSRVTSLSATATTLYLEGYIFVPNRNITNSSALYREVIFVNEDYPDADHAYRALVTTTYNGSFLTSNKTLNPKGLYNYSAATYRVSINYKNIKNYKQVNSSMAPGNYRIYIRASDGSKSAVFPLRDVTLSDGSNLSLPSTFSLVNNNTDGKRNLKVTIR